MPIAYDIQAGGHLIHAIAEAEVTGDELLRYNLAHTTDPRVNLPVDELLEIEHGAAGRLSAADLERVMASGSEPRREGLPHRCAIVVSVSDAHAWALAKRYESLAACNRAEAVIVFADRHTARTWLGLPSVAG